MTTTALTEEENSEDISKRRTTKSRTAEFARRHFSALSVLLLIAAVAVAAVFAYLWSDGRASARAADDRRAAVIQAGREFAAATVSYDYRKLDAFFEDLQARSGGGVRSDYTASRPMLTQALTSLQTISTGTVETVAITDGSGDIADLYVQLSTGIKTKDHPDPIPGRSVIHLELVHRDGRWLVDQLDTYLSPTAQPAK
ncbi:hypothetical protein [Nocardia sp. NPDC051570]|uniref:hypothetical protein n=1 Tax=Nocardia sp. NPDC051570 TaxID=3364324 RepID=UPI0037B2CF35